nr:EOG090X0LK7 [Sida crystallina]
MAKQAQMDIELKKAFGELQQKMVETSQKLKLSDIQIDSLKRNIAHAQLTEKEISLLPSETKTYESLGRMFVLQESTNVRKNLENKVKTCEEKIKTLEASKTYLERNLKESENNIREMIQHRKDAGAGESN